MRRFGEGVDRGQTTLFPESLDDWIAEENPVWVIDAFVDALDLAGLGFDGVMPHVTGRPSYHPSILLKLSIYGYLNRVQSSRRLERGRAAQFALSCPPTGTALEDDPGRRGWDCRLGKWIPVSIAKRLPVSRPGAVLAAPARVVDEPWL
jgi:hypothetical protein